MPRTTKTITFSLSPEIAERVDRVTRQQGKSRSEFLREAVLSLYRGIRVEAAASVWTREGEGEGDWPRERGRPGGRIPS